jgi:hypothetical protein
MEKWMADLVATMFILMTVGGFSTLIAWMAFRNKRIMKAAGSDDVGALREELAQLHDELAQQRDESSGQIAELHERLDFAERLLAQQRDPALPAPPAPPQRKRTPA